MLKEKLFICPMKITFQISKCTCCALRDSSCFKIVYGEAKRMGILWGESQNPLTWVWKGLGGGCHYVASWSESPLNSPEIIAHWGKDPIFP